MKTLWKSALVAIMAFVLGCASANAQFRFGIKAGVNLNSLSVKNLQDSFNSDNGCGFTGGIMTEFQVPIIGLCFDASLMYTHMSAHTDLFELKDNNLSNDEITPKKDFLEIPINLKYKLGIPVVHPYIFTGPSFAFKLTGDDNVLKTKTFQCAWNIGAGVELFSHLQIGASYGFGLNNIMEHVIDINTTDKLKIKNNYWTITAAYLF